MKIDWKRKLTSRKFWLSVASFVSMLMVACGRSESEASQVAALIMAGATVIGYAIAEGLADAGDHSTELMELIANDGEAGEFADAVKEAKP